MNMMLVLLVITVLLAVGLIGFVFSNFLGAMAGRRVDKLKATAEKDLGDLFIFMDYKKLVYVNIGAFLFVPVVVWVVTLNPILAAISLLLPIFAPKLIVNFIRKRRLEKFRYQFPDALVMISSSMRAGASLSVALENLVRESKPPLNQEFALMLRNQRLGVSFDDALVKMEERIPLQEFSLFSAGTRISREVGGNLADMLDALADTLFKTLQTEGKIKSLTSQGKMQGVVMAGLPLLLMFALNVLEPVAMHPLFHSLLGWGVLTLIAVMEFMGYMFIRKITDIDV
ncbi:MAG: type II secretion system F family protein [Xanthomonadaceae bacterium]|nr:type II secretion system F family protein [Xanthomonadaceae bacterium]MDE1959401.1 type II secretion system F family protein [Xanthomonadaceae bacterium]MDE2178160.1 type II secretion system F family protein [Xanthomonadaceae bacterium]MDE2246740.1 type II secretion system F family protein [Xanthomonadaceae bacterium]